MGKWKVCSCEDYKNTFFHLDLSWSDTRLASQTLSRLCPPSGRLFAVQDYNTAAAKLSISCKWPSLLLSFYCDAPDCQSAAIISCLLHLLALFRVSRCLQVTNVLDVASFVWRKCIKKKSFSTQKPIVFISPNCLMPWYLQPATCMEMSQRSAGCSLNGAVITPTLWDWT